MAEWNHEWIDLPPNRKYLSDLENALRETRERMANDLKASAWMDPPKARVPDTWGRRVELAWEALCGRITWDDIR